MGHTVADLIVWFLKECKRLCNCGAEKQLNTVSRLVGHPGRSLKDSRAETVANTGNF